MKSKQGIKKKKNGETKEGERGRLFSKAKRETKRLKNREEYEEEGGGGVRGEEKGKGQTTVTETARKKEK